MNINCKLDYEEINNVTANDISYNIIEKKEKRRFKLNILNYTKSI